MGEEFGEVIVIWVGSQFRWAFGFGRGLCIVCVGL